MRVGVLSAVLLSLCLIASGKTEDGVAGKWYGNANFSTGSNFNTDWYELMTVKPGDRASRMTGAFDGKIGWKSKKLDIKLLAEANSSYQMTSFSGLNIKIESRDTSYNVDYSQKKTISSDYLIGTELTYRPGSDDKIFFRFHHKQEYKTPYNASYGLKVDKTASAQSQEEKGSYAKYSFKPKLEWEHSFEKKGRKLFSSLSWDYIKDNRTTIWDIESGKYRDEYILYDSTGRIYRLTPQYIDNDISLLVRYSDMNFCNVRNLNMEFSLNAVRNGDQDDYSGANLVKEQWIDSTRLKESFDYVSLSVEPRIRALYSIGQFKFDWMIAPQYFTDRLKNSMEVERFDAGRVDMLFDMKSWWVPNQHHTVFLKFGKSVTRPDYLQMCWFQRPGVFSNELRQGNPDLLPMSTYFLSTEYGFIWNRFLATLEIGYKSKYDQIEQTYNMEEIDGKTFRVYTWINAGRSETENVKLSLGWKDKVVKAGVSANVNHFYGFSADGKRSTDSFDMEVKADLSVKLPWDITIFADGKYQSKIKRVYGSMSSYIACNAKISKTFKHFNVFLEGRDLLDKPVTVETYSAEGTEARFEERANNRRIFKLGIGLSFL